MHLYRWVNVMLFYADMQWEQRHSFVHAALPINKDTSHLSKERQLFSFSISWLSQIHSVSILDSKWITDMCMQTDRHGAHMVEAAEAACECHSDLAVRKAENTEAHKELMSHSSTCFFLK